MNKIFLATLLSLSTLLASEYQLDTEQSKVYYEAKKKQFFVTYTINGINRDISGLIRTESDNYQGELSIDASKFKTDSSMRDSNVAKDLNAKAHPNISFKYEIKSNKARGTMSVNGVSKVLEFPVTIRDEAQALFIDGNITVQYKDFGIETPSNLILTAHDSLVIGAHLKFNK